MNRFKLCFLSLLTLFFNHLSAIELFSNLQIEGGYRHDEYRTKYTNYFDNFAFLKDVVQIKNLDIGTFGASGRLYAPHHDDCFPGPLSNFYIGGFAQLGWGARETMRREVSVPFDIIQDFARAKMNWARTYDYQVGLGYVFDLACWFNPCSTFDWVAMGLGFSGGYSYDRQDIKFRNGTSELNIFNAGITLDPDPLYNGLKYSQSWQGPWVGVELIYTKRDWTFVGGYEYHFKNRYLLTWDVPDNLFAQLEDYSDRRKGNQGHANVAYFSMYDRLCDGFIIGITVKYQNWDSGHYHRKPKSGTFADHLDPTTKSTGHTVWRALGVTGNFGYSF